MKKANKKKFFKQRMLGLMGVIIGVMVPFLADGDATASLFLVPMGLYAMFTKYYILVD